ncbi:MAG: LLM class flavin-dependent oxidoreductase [Acidobacteria bacterium]|nr:LLM class flavin-dependent oxidoreductase [Acidobacteriota bacterium]MCZ6752468.1 LLM class flavin-dependent oxidoreductase [Acidobacteriota bacterium]
MKVGIGLPTTILGTDRALILEWARRADEGRYSTLGIFDRFAYDSFEPLTTLAAAAAVTERIRLATTILTGPLHNTAMLAKAAASVDALSGGRLVLGLALGAREADYKVAGVEYRSRGRRLSEQLGALRSYWEENTFGPKPSRPGGPELLVGGTSEPAFARMARYANGYLHGGGPPRAFARAAEKARAAWFDAGRPDKLHLWGMGYYALGEDAVEAGIGYMKDYYSFAGPFADRITAGLLTTPNAIAEFIQGYQEAGCDELLLFPTVGNITQLTRLAEAVG